MSIPQALLRDEIPKNEAYVKVRRSASGPEGRGMRVTRPFGFTQGHEFAEWQMGVFRQPRYQLMRTLMPFSNRYDLISLIV